MITIDEAVYKGLHRVVGKGHISRFLENLARPHVTGVSLAQEYQEMAQDAEREAEAGEWCDALIGDISHEAR